MKGLSLPIEAIVIIAASVLVLVVLVAFFVGGTGDQVNSIDNNQALARGCTDLVVRYSCNLEHEDLGSDLSKIRIQGYSGGTLAEACKRLGFATAEECARLACRCRV